MEMALGNNVVAPSSTPTTPRTVLIIMLRVVLVAIDVGCGIWASTSSISVGNEDIVDVIVNSIVLCDGCGTPT